MQTTTSSARLAQAVESGSGWRPQDGAWTSRVRLAGWSLAVLLGMVETLWSRHAMQSDGICYLDMGDAIVRKDWAMAVNAYWSPLYPFLQGLALKVIKPSAYNQFTVVHIVNFLIFLFTLRCFEYLLHVMTVAAKPWDGIDRGTRPLPPWAVYSFGYTVFLWSMLSLVTLERVSPDLLMAGFLFLGVVLVLRIREEAEGLLPFALLGVVLGFGYLAKAAMFPLSFVLLAFAGVVARRRRRAAAGVLTALVAFAIVSGPWIAAISRAKGRFTFGDTGKINYVLMVNQASPAWYFQKLGTAGGRYIHSPRQIFDSPPIYEFSTPGRGTVRIWYDPSYWGEGAAPKLHVRRQAAVVVGYAILYFNMLFSLQTALLVGYIVLALLAVPSQLFRLMRAWWPVWLMGLAGLAMYALVTVEMRYIAVFLALCWLGLFAGVAVQYDRIGWRATGLVTVAVVIAMGVPVVRTAEGHLRNSLAGQPHREWLVAQDLLRMGVEPGTLVGRIGGRYEAGWARLLGASVIAEVPRDKAMEYWTATPQRQEQAIESFRRLGIGVLVAEHVPPDPIFTPGPGWKKLGDGEYYGLKIAPRKEK